MAVADLFGRELQVINIGLPVFYETLEVAGVKACFVNQPPDALNQACPGAKTTAGEVAHD